MDYCVTYYKSHIFISRKNTIFNEQEQLHIVAISGIQEDENNTIIMTTGNTPPDRKAITGSCSSSPFIHEEAV